MSLPFLPFVSAKVCNYVKVYLAHYCEEWTYEFLECISPFVFLRTLTKSEIEPYRTNENLVRVALYALLPEPLAQITWCPWVCPLIEQVSHPAKYKSSHKDESGSEDEKSGSLYKDGSQGEDGKIGSGGKDGKAGSGSLHKDGKVGSGSLHKDGKSRSGSQSGNLHKDGKSGSQEDRYRSEYIICDIDAIRYLPTIASAGSRLTIRQAIRNMLKNE